MQRVFIITMLEFIKRWKERRRRKAILKDIKEAKKIYLEGKVYFMCLCFSRVDPMKYDSFEFIKERIPEYNRTFLGADPDLLGTGRWWPIDDRESRIKAFDKLIEIYSK